MIADWGCGRGRVRAGSAVIPRALALRAHSFWAFSVCSPFEGREYAGVENCEAPPLLGPNPDRQVSLCFRNSLCHNRCVTVPH